MTDVSPSLIKDRIFASPLARRLAKQKGIDLSLMRGSGPHGRIIERDVATAEPISFNSDAAQRNANLSQPVSDDVIRKYYEPGAYSEVPHDAMRKAIARRLTDSVTTIPQFFLDVDCEIDTLLRLRQDFNGDAPKTKEGVVAWKTSVNDYLIKALALALQRVPETNVTFTSNVMLKHHASNIGVAVAIPGGLISPIIKNAEKKSVLEISEEVKRLALLAREHKLRPEQYEGGVSSVSNLGMYGIKRFSAIINPPQSSILAVGLGEERMVVRDGAPHCAQMMTITLTCDHRAIDGALGAQFLSEIKHFIEHPAGMFV